MPFCQFSNIYLQLLTFGVKLSNSSLKNYFSFLAELAEFRKKVPKNSKIHKTNFVTILRWAWWTSTRSDATNSSGSLCSEVTRVSSGIRTVIRFRVFFLFYKTLISVSTGINGIRFIFTVGNLISETVRNSNPDEKITEHRFGIIFLYKYTWNNCKLKFYYVFLMNI